MALVSSLQASCLKLGVKSTYIPKASEFHELLETRISATSLSALRLPGSCKLVICLDLAARHAGITPALTDVVRLSGVSKKNYTEAFKVVSALLGVEDRTSLRELAVQFGCPKVVPQAADILQRYTRDQCSDIDFGSSLFLCAALLVAAKQEKVKIDSIKLKERSGTKKATFDRLIAELQKYVIDTSSAEKIKSSSTKRRRGLMETIDAQIQEDDKAAKRAKLKEQEELEGKGSHEKKDTYEDWKRKILEKSAKSSS